MINVVIETFHFASGDYGLSKVLENYVAATAIQLDKNGSGVEVRTG